ncbi:hypothetical protein HJC23_003190 [Cyclotella cryptica]|uniref:Circumsporozoite protein n=1 Tax=Cyclotella cryptica TaxID=29204 RepID=A0ABD3NRX3_9STRA
MLFKSIACVAIAALPISAWQGGTCPTLPTNPESNGWSVAMAPNDDGSSALQNIGFAFDFFGTSFNQLYINNNGNLSFGSPFSTYSSTGFPVTGFPMIAPYWADVDTRNGWGQVLMKPLVNAYAVVWDHVGAYGNAGVLRNTFMVIISNGNDSAMGLGNNVCFCYGDMQWATSGSGGFGETPATVGANKGDGVAYQSYGRYSAPGSGAQGIDLLDDKTICFSTSTINQPPNAIGVPAGNEIRLERGQSVVNEIISFAAPEGDQTVQVTYSISGDPTNGLTVVIKNNIQTATATISWSPTLSGNTHLTIIATDNGIPQESTEVVIDLISITPSEVPSMSPSAMPSLMTSLSPSQPPSESPSESPSQLPSKVPSRQPSSQPSAIHSSTPSESAKPSNTPSEMLSKSPSAMPSVMPSLCPSKPPSESPSGSPSQLPSKGPSRQPSIQPSVIHSEMPSESNKPSNLPSSLPSSQPSRRPSSWPSPEPSSQPSFMPSLSPSHSPTLFPSLLPSMQPSVVEETVEIPGSISTNTNICALSDIELDAFSAATLSTIQSIACPESNRACAAELTSICGFQNRGRSLLSRSLQNSNWQ